LPRRAILRSSRRRRSDLEKLRAELVKTEERLRTEMENLRAEIKTEMGKLEERLERRISALESRVNSIEERLARLEGQMNLFVKLFIAFNLPILIAVIGILLKMIFS